MKIVRAAHTTHLLCMQSQFFFNLKCNFFYIIDSPVFMPLVKHIWKQKGGNERRLESFKLNICWEKSEFIYMTIINQGLYMLTVALLKEMDQGK